MSSITLSPPHLSTSAHLLTDCDGDHASAEPSPRLQQPEVGDAVLDEAGGSRETAHATAQDQDLVVLRGVVLRL